MAPRIRSHDGLPDGVTLRRVSNRIMNGRGRRRDSKVADKDGVVLKLKKEVSAPTFGRREPLFTQSSSISLSLAYSACQCHQLRFPLPHPMHSDKAIGRISFCEESFRETTCRILNRLALETRFVEQARIQERHIQAFDR